MGGLGRPPFRVYPLEIYVKILQSYRYHTHFLRDSFCFSTSINSMIDFARWWSFAVSAANRSSCSRFKRSDMTRYLNCRVCGLPVALSGKYPAESVQCCNPEIGRARIFPVSQNRDIQRTEPTPIGVREILRRRRQENPNFLSDVGPYGQI